MDRAFLWAVASVCAAAIVGCGPDSSSGSTAGTGASGSGGSAGSNSTSSAGSAGSAGTGGTSSGSAGAAGSSGSAGTAGTGGTSTAVEVCPAGKYILCEDFEGTAVGDIPQGWEKHGDPVAVSDDAAANGAHSLKMGPIDSWERRIYHDGTILGSGHWGRIRFKVMLPVPDAFVHSTIVTLHGDGPTVGPAEVRVVDTVKEDKDGFNNDGNGSHFQYLYNVQPNGAEFGTGSNYDYKFDDAWHCAEWHIDAPTQSYEFYIDGMKIDKMTLMNGAGNYTGTEIPDVFDQIRIGWNNYQSAPPGFTAWVDDVTFDKDRIGCQ